MLPKFPWSDLVYFSLIFLTILFTLFWLQRRNSRLDRVERIWQICRYQGGGKIYTPHPMTESNAIEFAGTLGQVMHVDREHGFIFVRSSH
jgi:hypothetical protein